MLNLLFRIKLYIQFLPWLQAMRLRDSNAKHVVVMFPAGYKKLYKYSVGNFVNDLCNIRYLTKNKIPFNVVRGRKFGNLAGKNVYLGVGSELNSFSFLNHSSTIAHWIKELEKQGNTVFYSSNELAFWENKVFMHQEFENKGIRCPKTQLLPVNQILSSANTFQYPYLIKWPHSAGSRDLYAIHKEEDAKEFVAKFNYAPNYTVIVQEKLNMMRDLRVICTPNQILSSYWRINMSDSWKPTSTRRGNRVDFGNFPSQWEDWFKNILKKLDLRVGAFDIAWDNDDITTEPYVLEVSPSFSPNPAPDDDKFLGNYGAYKKKLLRKGSFLKKHLELQYTIREAVLDELKIA